jgi:putative flippase GtrA
MLKWPSGNTFYQLCKYGIAGGIGAGIDLGLYAIIITLTPLNYLLANAISFSLGTLVVYFLQKDWTFQYQEDKNVRLFSRYISFVAITYLLNNIILIICIELLHITPILSKVFQILISFFWGYTISKMFVFK